MRTFYQFALADFRERSRQYGFFITMMVIVFLGYLINNGDLLIMIGPNRGVYNSAWVGSLMTLTVTTFVGLLVFYLIKNSIKRDIQTGVGQIIAATPSSRLTYLLGKWFSHIILLSLMLVILIAAAFIMQLLYREVPGINVWALVAPFLFVALPTLAMIGGLAVLFEAIPWLRGGVGNIVYFFLYMGFFPFVIEGFEKWGLSNDPWGLRLFMPSMQKSACEVLNYCKDNFSFSTPFEEITGTFLWSGIQWTPEIILPRLLWIGIGFVFVLVGAVVFDRFDSTQRIRKNKKKTGTVKQAETAEVSVNKMMVIKPLTSLKNRKALFSFGRVWFGEVLLLIKAYPLWIYGVLIGLLSAAIFSPIEVTINFLLPASWIIPILLWSKMGCRESEFNTHQLVFTAPNLFQKQWLASYLAGVFITALSGSGALISFLIHQPNGAVAAWFVAIFFIPALALASGSVSGTSRAFEIIYALIWYMGPLQHLPALDFIGPAGVPIYTPVYAVITLGLIIIALLARFIRLRTV